MRNGSGALSTAIAATLCAAAWTCAAVESAVASKTGVRSELSSRLYELTQPELRGATNAELAEALSLPAKGFGSLLRDGNLIIVEVRVANRTRGRAAGIRGPGADVLDISPAYRTVTVAVSRSALAELAARPGVEAVTEVLAPTTAQTGANPMASAPVSTCAGSVTSEGDTQLQAINARQEYNVDGTGVEVGVLSDSYDRNGTDATDAGDDIASGDLPGPGNPCGRTTPVQVLDDGAPDPLLSALGDEGRAMAQLVHDLAPGADLSIATAFTGVSSFANNIRALADAGARVIVDDVSYADEPFFQDGPIAVAVNDVTAQGVSYYSSAANNNIIAGANNIASWEAPAFRPSAGCPLGIPPYESACMDFNPDPTPTTGDDNTYAIDVPNGRTLTLDIQYAQPWNGVTTDLDAYLLNSANAVVDMSEEANVTGSQKPFEFLSFTNNTGILQPLRLVIGRYTGVGGGDTANPRVKLIFFGNGGQTVVPTEYTTSNLGDVVGPTIFGHNGAANAVSTAAVPFNNSAMVEPFSSRGPVTQYFGPVSGATPAPPLGPQVLAKPDLSATDNSRTTFFTPSGGIFRFRGTSAAAPHAAAVAALQLDANPDISVAQLKSAQRSTATPVGSFAATAAGTGLVNALAAVPANPPAAPTVAIQAPGATADSTPAIPFTINGDAKVTSCSIDGAPVVNCTSPYTPATSLADGARTLTVAATDYFGAAGSAAATFTVDTTAPTVKIKKGPKQVTRKRKARFVFTAEAGAILRCRLDKAAARMCHSPAKFKVKPGKHKLKLSATDAVGNVGTAKYKWKRER